MVVGVGSTNKVKVQAVVEALSGKMPTVQVLGCAVSSMVSAQPMSDEETKRGAFERAVGAQKKLRSTWGVGLEGGVFLDQGQVWNTVWCCVVDEQGKTSFANGSRFLLPDKLSRALLKGIEMGDAMDALTGISDVRIKMGMLGVVTDGWVNRESEYCHLVQLTMGRLLSDWK